MLDTIKLKCHQGNKYIKDIRNAQMRSQFRGFPILNSALSDIPDEACCPTGALKYGDVPIVFYEGINPNYLEELEQIIEKAKNNPNERQKLVIGKVTKKLARQAKEYGFDIEGYSHDLDVSGVRHAFLEHGTEKTEFPRGQIPITDNDFKAIPNIVYFYDEIEFTGKNKTGLETITYKKVMNNNMVFYVEEIRNGKETLTINTIYKHKNAGNPRTSADKGNPLSNAGTNIITDFNENFNSNVNQYEEPAKRVLSIDMGKCTFCGKCKCEAIRFSNRYKLGSTSRDRLIITEESDPDEYEKQAIVARKEIKKVFSKSLKLRQVSAGGCNGCEMELNACSNCNFDMGRFGIDFVASPRHADGLVITGSISENMAWALEDCYKSTPDPKIVILAGACAISGGVFQTSDKLNREFLEKYPVDLYIPGCPIHPLTFINAVLSFITGK